MKPARDRATISLTNVPGPTPPDLGLQVLAGGLASYLYLPCKVSVVDLKDKPQGQSLDGSASVPSVEWSQWEEEVRAEMGTEG